MDKNAHRNRISAVIGILLLAPAAVMLPGCPKIEPLRLDANTLVEIEQLKIANQDLRRKVGELETQVATLQDLGDKRLDRLYTVQRISLGISTGGVNLDDQPGDDGVKVTVTPIDQAGSHLKAAGCGKVQVYDLAAPEGENLVAECSYDANTTAKGWVDSLFGSYYSFQCEWRSGPPAHCELTVRAEFTDYLTGKSFTDQKVIQVELPPKAKDEPKTRPATAPATKSAD